MNADFDRDELIQLVDRLATGTIEPAINHIEGNYQTYYSIQFHL